MSASRVLRSVTCGALVLSTVLISSATSAHAQGDPDRSLRAPAAPVQLGTLRIPRSVFAAEPPARAIAGPRLATPRVLLQPATGQRSWPARHPSKLGALIGLGAGIAMGAVASRDHCFLHHDESCLGASMLIFGGIGAATGTLVGLAF